MKNFDEAITRLENYKCAYSEFFQTSEGWNDIFKKRNTINSKNITMISQGPVVFGTGGYNVISRIAERVRCRTCSEVRLSQSGCF